MNDIDVMSRLIDCSRAGVKVELFIRGICCLCPGLPGYTDNVTVRSVVGRYLEHSRIYVFGKDQDQRVYIGSGDMLNRNTQRRVEAFIEVRSDDTKKQVLEVMDAFRNDDVKGWEMQQDGTYVKAQKPHGADSQERLAKYFSGQRIEALPEEEKKGNSLMSLLKKWLGVKR